MSSDNLVLHAIYNRRSIRKFESKPVAREQIQTILEAGRWAPSGLNSQPWRFMPIHQKDPRQRILANSTKYSKIVEQAHSLIVVLLDKSSSYDYTKDCQSVGACVQNMLLAIHSMGLGGVWLGEILNQESQVMQGLDLDINKYQLMAVVALGYPAQEGHSERKSLNKLMMENY